MIPPEERATFKRYAKMAGLLYLVIIVGAGFGEGYVRQTLLVSGDAATTASNIRAAETLFRFGFLGDLVAFMADAAVAVLLYVILRPVSRTLSLMAAAFRLVAHPAIGSVNLLNHLGALVLLGNAGTAGAFPPDQLEALALASLELHGYGYLIGGAFFGVHLALLGYLLYRSDLFPKWLGVLLLLAAAGYLTESFTAFVIPALAELGASFVVFTASLAEVSLCLWLLIRGVLPAPRPAEG